MQKGTRARACTSFVPIDQAGSTSVTAEDTKASIQDGKNKSSHCPVRSGQSDGGKTAWASAPHWFLVSRVLCAPHSSGTGSLPLRLAARCLRTCQLALISFSWTHWMALLGILKRLFFLRKQEVGTYLK